MSRSNEDRPEDSAGGGVDFTNPRAGWIIIAVFTAAIIAIGYVLTH